MQLKDVLILTFYSCHFNMAIMMEKSEKNPYPFFHFNIQFWIPHKIYFIGQSGCDDTDNLKINQLILRYVFLTFCTNRKLSWFSIFLTDAKGACGCLVVFACDQVGTQQLCCFFNVVSLFMVCTISNGEIKVFINQIQ